MAIGFAASGLVGVGGSVGVNTFSNTTRASIGANAEVLAGGSVIVKASDDSSGLVVAGAAGIGLVRTERMFNSTDRLPIVQEMILAETPEERQAVRQLVADDLLQRRPLLLEDLRARKGQYFPKAAASAESSPVMSWDSTTGGRSSASSLSLLMSPACQARFLTSSSSVPEASDGSVASGPPRAARR